MTRGSKRCGARGCRRQASGAVLFSTWNGGRFFGVNACQEHLEDSTRRTIADRATLNELVLLAARGNFRPRPVLRSMGPPVGKKKAA